MEAHRPIEARRLELQGQLDTTKTRGERNKLGQFATPTALATDMLTYAKSLLSADTAIRFLDPAFGTGSFYSALLQVFPASQVTAAFGYEVDERCGLKARELWADTNLQLNIADFTRVAPPITDEMRENLVICNPPYVRHHHLLRTEKQRLQQLLGNMLRMRLSGLAGLYCYFLLLSHAWMSENALAGWLIPSEFMNVNYGQQIKAYLLDQVTLLRIHRFNPIDVQFGDSLVSSAAVWFRKTSPDPGHTVQFTYGGTLAVPEKCEYVPATALQSARKWTQFASSSSGQHSLPQSLPHSLKLADMFTIHRGLATGANQFFILTEDQVKQHRLPAKFLTPILPSARYLSVDEIKADTAGNPVLPRQLFLLTCDLSEDVVKSNYPTLWRYLQVGVNAGVSARYSCQHRMPWYSQEKRSASPLLCTYMGRQGKKSDKPFRFILNHSRAIAANTYLMLYPKPALEKVIQEQPERLSAIWHALNRITSEALIREGRVYGGGLHKLEPKELANISIDDVWAFSTVMSATLWTSQAAPIGPLSASLVSQANKPSPTKCMNWTN